jgi:hypothetical protein
LAEFADPSSRSEPDTRPDDDDSAPEVRRLNTDAATTLEQFQRSPLLEHGQINLLALDAIGARRSMNIPVTPLSDMSARAAFICAYPTAISW